jgi:spermidine/putrescine transport system permease protein
VGQIAPSVIAPPGSAGADAARHAGRRRWLLLSPALVVIGLASAGPLLIVLLYSLLEKGEYAGVVGSLSLDAWFTVFLERDIFDGTVRIADAHLTIFLRSLRLAFLSTLLAFVVGFPTAYFIATRPERSRNLWLFLITIPFWTNLLIRTFAIMEILRNEGVVNVVLIATGVIAAPVQMLYTDFAIAVGLIYVYLPLMVLPLYASIEKLDFPLVRPGMIAGSILVFIPALGAYVTPRILGGGKNLMLGNLIEFQFGQGRNWPLGSALALALMALVMVALLVYVRATSPTGDDHRG